MQTPVNVSDGGTQAHLLEYLAILSRRKRFIMLFTLVLLFVVIVRNHQAVPQYRSAIEMVVEPKTIHSPITGKRVAYESPAAQRMDIGTHFKLIKSKTVLKAVVQTLELDKRQEKPTAHSPIKWARKNLAQLIPTWVSPSKKAPVRQTVDPISQKINARVRQLRGRIKVKQLKSSRLILISVLDPDPVMAASIANQIGRQYIHFDQVSRSAPGRDKLAWLTQELSDVKTELEQHERQFFEFKAQNKVFSMEGKQKVADQKIAEFNSRYLEVRNRRLDLDSKIKQLARHLKSSDSLIKIQALINNPLVESIYSKIVNLEIERSKLSKIYRHRHPKMILVNSELEKSRRQLDFELKRELVRLKSEHAVVADQEKNLEKTIGEFEEDALDSSSNELTYAILQRNVKSSQDLYETLRSRIKESNLLKNYTPSNIRIVEAAEIPTRPVLPRKRFNLIIGLILGLAGGSLLALLFEYMDQTYTSRERLEKDMGLPVLAMIPESRAQQEKSI